MQELIFSRRTWIWLVLVGATLLSWEMGHGLGFSQIRYASTAIILVAFFKTRYVILEFMEIRHAPVPMRIAAELWVVAACAILLVLYWNGGGTPA